MDNYMEIRVLYFVRRTAVRLYVLQQKRDALQHVSSII